MARVCLFEKNRTECKLPAQSRNRRQSRDETRMLTRSLEGLFKEEAVIIFGFGQLGRDPLQAINTLIQG